MTALQAEVLPRGDVVQADARSLMDVIARAANDPNTDVDKLERLMGLYERITSRQAEQAFNEAMSAAQGELRAVSADADNSQTKSKYATYTALDRAVRPIYHRHGFALSFDTGEGAPADCVRVVCYVSHNGGHRQTYHIDMPADGKGAKGGDVMTKTHATGAAMSYGQRYLLKLIFNIAVGDDTDGNAPPSAAVDAAIAAINDLEGREAFRTWKSANTDALKALSARDADTIIRHFNTRFNKIKGGDHGTAQ